MKRSRIAIAISTVVFLVVSGVFHMTLGEFALSHMPRWPQPAPDQSPMIITPEHLIRATPTPTPPPTPPPPPSPRHDQQMKHPSRAAHPRTHVPHTRSTPSPLASPVDAGSPLPTAQPTTMPVSDQTASPQPVATPVMAGADVAAYFKHKVVPEFPRVCEDAGASGSVTVFVTISADGSVAAAWVGQTSGFPCLDAAALEAAKESTYYPPEVAGRPVAETYRILYEFQVDS